MNIKQIIKKMSENEKNNELVMNKVLDLGGCNSLYGPFKYNSQKSTPLNTPITYPMFAEFINNMHYGTLQDPNGNEDFTKIHYGSGPTRSLSTSSYSARQVITIPKVKLLSGFFDISSEEFEKFLKLESLIENEKSSNFYDDANFFEFASGKTKEIDENIKNKKLHLYVANVDKINSSFFGDLILHSSENLGLGSNLINPGTSSVIKTVEAFSPEHYNKTKLMEKTAISFMQQKAFEKYAFSISDKFRVDKVLTVYNL
jgi:hypothetical protein